MSWWTDKSREQLAAEVASREDGFRARTMQSAPNDIDRQAERRVGDRRGVQESPRTADRRANDRRDALKAAAQRAKEKTMPCSKGQHTYPLANERASIQPGQPCSCGEKVWPGKTNDFTCIPGSTAVESLAHTDIPAATLPQERHNIMITLSKVKDVAKGGALYAIPGVKGRLGIPGTMFADGTTAPATLNIEFDGFRPADEAVTKAAEAKAAKVADREAKKAKANEAKREKAAKILADARAKAEKLGVKTEITEVADAPVDPAPATDQPADGQ